MRYDPRDGLTILEEPNAAWQEGDECPVHRIVHSAHGWYVCFKGDHTAPKPVLNLTSTRLDVVWDLAQDYYDSRPLPWHTWSGSPRGNKVAEEADELVEALQEHYEEPGPDTQHHVFEEIGDVAISLAWIAKSYGTTVEECMRLKTEVDRGRGTKPKEQHAKDKALVDGLGGLLPLSPQDISLLSQ